MLNSKDIKKRLLFISSDKFPPFRVDVAVLFGKELVNRNYQIHWLLQSERNCKHSYQTKWKGGRVWVGATDNGTSRWRRLRKHLYNTLNQLRVVPLARINKYDIIQVKDEFISAVPAIIAAKRSNSKFVYWLSYPIPEASIQRAKDGTARYPFLYFIRGLIFKLLLYRVIMSLADHIFVQSEQMKKDVLAMGIPEHKLTPVPMGVEIEKIPYRESRNFQITTGQEKKVLYLGTLVKVRRIDFLIRVFARVSQRVVDSKLYLVGSGEDPSDEQLLLDEAKHLGIEESLIISGFLPMQEAWDYVHQADVCVSPFCPTFILNSTSPTKLIEYMAMGKAVVGNDHPEQRLVLAESGAGLCVPYDEKAFAAAVVELLNDPDRAREMGRKGREYVEKHRSYNIIADIVEREYMRICREKNRSSSVETHCHLG